MKICGVPLHIPRREDLPQAAFILVLAIAFAGLAMLFLGWDIAQASAIVLGLSVTALSTACGVDLHVHGLRGLLVFGMILLAVVATMVGIDFLIS